MNRRTTPAVLFLVAALTWIIVGLHTVPRNTTYIVLGIAFALIAAAQFMRARKQG